MARLAVLLSLFCLVGACYLENSDRQPLPRPTIVRPPPPGGDPPPVPIPAVPISLGQEVQGRFVGFSTRLAYELTVSSSGTLVARLTWDPSETGAFLRLTVGNAEFIAAEPAFSPIVGRIPVSAGETYRLIISPGGTDHDYDVPFVLTTSLER